MSKPSLKNIAKNMSCREPNEKFAYYQLSLVASENDQPLWSVNSHWVGFQDDERKIELRKASIIRADRIVEAYRNELREGCFVVETLVELRTFLLLGGHAVVEQKIAEKKTSRSNKNKTNY